jgi:hypothetical protein
VLFSLEVLTATYRDIDKESKHILRHEYLLLLFNIILPFTSYHHGMTRPQVSDERDVLQIRRVELLEHLRGCLIMRE